MAQNNEHWTTNWKPFTGYYHIFQCWFYISLAIQYWKYCIFWFWFRNKTNIFVKYYINIPYIFKNHLRSQHIKSFKYTPGKIYFGIRNKNRSNPIFVWLRQILLTQLWIKSLSTKEILKITLCNLLNQFPACVEIFICVYLYIASTHRPL